MSEFRHNKLQFFHEIKNRQKIKIKKKLKKLTMRKFTMVKINKNNEIKRIKNNSK